MVYSVHSGRGVARHSCPGMGFQLRVSAVVAGLGIPVLGVFYILYTTGMLQLKTYVWYHTLQLKYEVHLRINYNYFIYGINIISVFHV